MNSRLVLSWGSGSSLTHPRWINVCPILCLLLASTMLLTRTTTTSFPSLFQLHRTVIVFPPL
ncbi:hypothetical protein Gorai_019223 [Gossypium raimondii]|uniref:Uncharacterized protein n=1 Tax=Gossypium raimondii TaxID=29730 RepID=A0A7J8PMK8_GOSRA|nr:hypothetical protein [Gossypium raimondii]